jgi:COMPASS component SPP1
MSDHLKPTAESQNENSQSWSEPPGQAYVPADSTVDDDILADLDMAESQNLDANTATRLSSPYPSDRMDLDFPSPSPIPTHPAPSKTPSSMATPSPAPSAIIPSTTSNPKKKSASKSTAKASQSGNASKASTSAKAKGSTAKTAGGKNKNDLLKPSAAGSVRGKKSDSDVAWTGTSSGRAAAAAATAALGNFEYGDDLDTRSPAAGATSGTAKAAWDEEDDEEVDRRLYCVCRELYDDRFMLGCDG